MEKDASNTDELNKKLTLLKVELAKKKSKLEKQKRYSNSRKKRLESANHSNCNDTEEIVRPETTKTVKFEDVTSVSQVCDENFEDDLFRNSQLTVHEQYLSNSDDKCNIKGSSIDNKSSDNALETDSNKLANREPEEFSNTNINQYRSVQFLKAFLNDEEINHTFNSIEFIEVFRPRLNSLCRPIDLQCKNRPIIRTMLIETLSLKNEFGRVLFCDRINDMILVVQQHVFSLFLFSENGDWSVVHEYLREEYWRFCGSHYNKREEVFIELNENSVEFFISIYSAKEPWQMRSTTLATFPIVPQMTIHCFSDHYFAFAYQLEVESPTHILSLEYQKEKVNNMADLESRITFVHFLDAPADCKELLLACSDIGECYLYNVYGVQLQTYKLPLLTDPCLHVSLEKNFIFLMTGRESEKKIVLAVLNILTKQYKVLRDYQLTSTESVTDKIIFTTNKKLVALGKESLTAWDIKTGEVILTLEKVEPGTIFFQQHMFSLYKDTLLFLVNDKGNSVKLLSLILDEIELPSQEATVYYSASM